MKTSLLASLCLLATSLAVSAQEPPAPPPARHPAPAPPLAANDLIVPADEGRVEVRMKNTNLEDILAVYGHLIGKQIVYDASVQGRLNVVSDGAINKEAAMTLIEEAIFLNGFALVDSEDGGIVKVIGLGRPVRPEGLPVFESINELPKRVRVVTMIFHLEHADAQETAGRLTQYIPPGASIGFTAIRPGLLLVTAPTPLLRTLAKIVTTLDVSDREWAPATPPRPPIRP